MKKTDGDLLAWLDANRVYIGSERAGQAGSWYIDYVGDAWESGLIEEDGGAYIERDHATLREALRRVSDEH